MCECIYFVYLSIILMTLYATYLRVFELPPNERYFIEDMDFI
jgi:hypothetical protein